jgi:hypothetical protein
VAVQYASSVFPNDNVATRWGDTSL